jgi:hypothetical protein
MFLVLDNADHEYYRTGEIVVAVGKLLSHPIRQVGVRPTAAAGGALHPRGAE